MGRFDFFKRKPQLPVNLPEVLIEAAHRQDAKALARLCTQHRDEIYRSFSEWKTVPLQFRNDAEELNRYCEGLIAVASFFQSSGDSALLRLLQGDDADNPLVLWERDLTYAGQLMDEDRAAEAIGLLHAVLDRTRELTGSGAESHSTRTLGSLGAAYYRAGDKVKALEYTQKALEMCRQVGDQEGVSTYTGNILHIQKAPNEMEYQMPDGTWNSDINAVGDEPTNYRILDEEPIPAKAQRLHDEGRAKGRSGDYTAALTLLRQASEIAPNWAYPYYDMAFTYLLQGDMANALLYYRQVNQMKPQGFFTAKTALWTLEREEKGVFPKGTYLAYVSLEWMKPEEKRASVEEMTAALPSFAPAWMKRALLEAVSDERLVLLRKALSLDPDPETQGTCVVNLAAELHSSGKAGESRRLLEELIANDTSPASKQSMAKEVLKTFPK